MQQVHVWAILVIRQNGKEDLYGDGIRPTTFWIRKDAQDHLRSLHHLGIVEKSKGRVVKFGEQTK